MTIDGLSRGMRQQACLTLGHLDADRGVRCAATTDRLVDDLITEVRNLRALNPDAQPPARREVDAALAGALTEVSVAEVPDDEVVEALLDALAAEGWALVRFAR